MPSWSQLSPETVPTEAPGSRDADAELETMRRRFVEALRRAEIVSLLTAAEDEEQLGRSLAEELCEVYEAEIGLVVTREGDREPWRPVGVVGARGAARDRLLAAPQLAVAAGAVRAAGEVGDGLLGVEGRSCLLAGFSAEGERRVVIGVVRLYEQEFDPAETALLDNVALSAGQALERLWAHEERTELIAKLKASFVGTAEALANALEAKDDYTANHASEVADLAVEVGAELGLEPDQLEELRYGAIFHDIGKIAIPDSILHKAGPLDPDERAEMMRHPEIGAEMIEPIPFLSDSVRAMVRHDHEHFDGSGYPDGLRGEDIPLGARIILAVDSLHAMTSDRPYREAMPRAEALAELDRHAGTQFDPRVVEAVLRAIK